MKEKYTTYTTLPFTINNVNMIIDHNSKNQLIIINTDNKFTWCFHKAKQV